MLKLKVINNFIYTVFDSQIYLFRCDNQTTYIIDLEFLPILELINVGNNNMTKNDMKNCFFLIKNGVLVSE